MCWVPFEFFSPLHCRRQCPNIKGSAAKLWGRRWFLAQHNFDTVRQAVSYLELLFISAGARTSWRLQTCWPGQEDCRCQGNCKAGRTRTARANRQRSQLAAVRFDGVVWLQCACRYVHPTRRMECGEQCIAISNLNLERLNKQNKLWTPESFWLTWSREGDAVQQVFFFWKLRYGI